MSIADAYNAYSITRFPLASPDAVARFERDVDIRLPDDYREFLMHFNGGVFDEPVIALPSVDCPRDRLTLLHGLYIGDIEGLSADDVDAELSSYNNLTLLENNTPPSLLPIGQTMMGNLLLLVTAPGGDRGHILLKRGFSVDTFSLCASITDLFDVLESPHDD